MIEPTSLDSIEAIIDFAIEREREAQSTYYSYARETERRSFSQLLLSMAEMEREHERKLVALKQGAGMTELFTPPKTEDLGLAEMLIEVPFSPEMDYGDFLILVIRKEGEAEALYRRLGGLTENMDVKKMFRLLADEERKHKDWAQERYDQEILNEN
jgi:rubrerythrin